MPAALRISADKNRLQLPCVAREVNENRPSAYKKNGINIEYLRSISDDSMSNGFRTDPVPAESNDERSVIDAKSKWESRDALSPMPPHAISAAGSSAQSRAATPQSAHSEYGGDADGDGDGDAYGEGEGDKDRDATLINNMAETPSAQVDGDDDEMTETSSFHKTLNAIKPNLGTREELQLIQRVNNGELNIFDAARKNDCDTIRRICKAKPEMAAAKDWGNATALHLACMLRCYDAAETLLELGADASVKNPLGKLAFDYIKIPAKKAYLQRRADQFNPEGDYLDDDSTVAGPATEFRAAAYDGEMKKLDDMLQNDLSLLHSKDKKGTTALMFACMNRKFDCAYYLLEQGANIKDKTDYGHTAPDYILDKVHKERVKVFAFKMSAVGRAQSQAAFAKRKLEEKEAVTDCMTNIMEDIRELVLHREYQLMQKAETLSRLAADWAQNFYIEQGRDLAFDHAMRLFDDWQAELAREAICREEMAADEKQYKHVLFIQEQVERRRLERLEAERLIREADAIEAARLAQLERERIQREAKEEAARIKREASLRKAEKQALGEWEKMQQEERKQEWLEHCEKKPHRLKLYQRMRLSIAANLSTNFSGQFMNHDVYGAPTKISHEVKKFIINPGRMARDHDNLDLVILSQDEKNVVQGLARSKVPAHVLIPGFK